MEALQVVRRAFSFRELLQGAGFATLVSQFVPDGTTSEFRHIALRGLIVLFLLARSWLALVDHYVLEPYLVSLAFLSPRASITNSLQDEFFHVPQAQAYCEGRFSHWDDKITTPPGL